MVEKKFEKKRRKKWPRQSNQGGSDNLYSATIIEGLLGCFVSGSPISAIQEVEQLIEDFNISNLDHILRLPEILSKLQVDVFWILHLNGYIQFLEYINLTEAANVTEFIRRIYHAANAVTESIDDGKYMVPLSMCANIVLYLFNMTIAPGIPPLIDEKIRRILGDAFLPSPDMGPLDATDILIFTDLLATISCNIERDALQELQIEQISKLLSYQIRLHPVPISSLSSVAETAHKSHYIDFIQGSEYEGPQNNCEGKHGREENFLEDSHPNGPFDCLVNLQLPLIVYLRAFDRALRGEDSSSPFDFQRNNTLMAETIAGTYSVMYLLFESASLDGLSTWKTTIPFDLKAETISAYIESRLTEARSVKTTIGNDRLLSEGSKWTVFPLLSMLYLATASARAGINEGSHTLWLRAVCFAERVTNSLRTNTTVSVLGTLSARDHKAADPGSALFADWFDQILGSTSTSTELSIHEGHLNTDLVEMIPGNGAEEDLGLEIPNHENKAGMNAKTLEFACLALCDCISYQKESVIRIICKAFRSRRSLSKDAVDIYLQAARDQIARIEKLEASHSKAESSVQSVFLTPERVISWASTLCRTGFLPVGVLQTCKTAGPLGYRGLLRALKLLCTSSSSSSSSSGSSPGIRESCISVVTAMSVADPPLCPVIEANNFLKSEGGDKNSKDDYIDAFLSSLPLRPSLRESLKESLAIISHAYAAVSQKSVYLAGTRDLMIGRWKIACRAILDQKTFSVLQRQYKNDNEQNSLMAPLSSSSSIVDYKDDRGRDFVGISEDESNDDLVHLNIASSICTSYFHLVSTIMDNFLQGLGEPLPSSSSFSSSSFSSSSSSSTSSSSSFIFNCIPESSKTFFLNWHEYVQSICTILLSSNSRLISGIIVAGIVSQIRGESLDHCYNGMKINIPSVLLGITSDSQLRMILEMCMTHLFPLRDASSDVSSGARSGASDVSTADLCTINEKKCLEQRQLELFCESLYAVIMWHLTIIHYENEKVSDNFKGNEEHDTRQYKNSKNDSKSSSINVEVPLAILLQKHPFLCGLYIWIVDRCVCSPSFSSTVIPTETSNLDSYCSAYYSRDGPSVRTLCKDEWKLLARNIILYGCHHQRGSASSPNDKEYSTDSEHMKMKEYSTRMNLSNKLSFASSDDVMAAAVVETLLGDELTFFLRWEASFLGLTHVRSDQHSAFQDVWDVLNFGNLGFLDLTETVTVTATGTGTGTILGQDRRISAVHLKNVWDALIHCIASLVPTSTCVCCLAVLSSPSHIADISSRSEQISKFNGVCRGGVISTGLSKVISTLTQCVLHTQAGHLKHEKQFYPFLSEQALSVWFIAAKMELDTMRTMDSRSQGIFLVVSNILKLSSTAVNCKEHTYMSNMSNSLKDSDLNKTAGRHVPVFFRQCAQMVHFLASASTHKRKIELTFNCEEDENKCGPCHGYISSSSHTSLFPSFSSPSVLCWLPWLVSSIPLQTSELFLRTLDTKHLLDMIQGYGHSPLLKSHKLKRIELICFPLLASTVMVSQLIRSSPSSIISSSQSTDRESHNTNTDRAHHNKKRLFSNFWTADNSASDSARAKGRTTKDVIDLCLNDLQALFLITDVGTGDDEKSGTGTGTGAGAGTGAPQKSSDPLLHVFDTKLLKTLTFGGDTISSPSSRSIPTSRCPVVTTRNSKSTDTNNLIPGSIETDSPFLRGDKVEDRTERRKGQNYSYLQLKLIGIMGWGLLPCYCASSISTCDRNTHISSANDSSINSSNEKRDRSVTLNNFHNSSMSIGSGNPFFDVGKGAAAVKDIIQKILDYTDALVEEEGLDLGPCSSKNEGDKVLGENQEHLPVKSIPIHFCVSLLASCLTTTSTVGVKTSRCSTTSTSTSTSTLDKESGILSIKPIMAKLAAGVGPIVLSFLLKIIECHIKEELEVRGLSLESRTQDPLLSASIPCPLLASSMGVDQSWKEPEVDLGIYLACLHDLAMQLVVAELKAQVPESVISELMPRLSDMMTFATKSKQQSEQNRRRRR